MLTDVHQTQLYYYHSKFGAAVKKCLVKVHISAPTDVYEHLHTIPGRFLSRTSSNSHGSCETAYLSPYQDDGAPSVHQIHMSCTGSRLRMQTEPDHYPLQNIADVTFYFHKAKVFSTQPPGRYSLLHLPLYAPLNGKRKDLKWGPLQEAAICNAKNPLSTTAALTFPVPHAPLLCTDASDVTIGTVPEVNSSPHPLAFFRRKLSKVASGYSTFNRELLAVHSGVCHVCYFLGGTPFVIHTDHMPLVHAFTRQSDACSARQCRPFSNVAKYNCTVQHVPGKMTPVVDTLQEIHWTLFTWDWIATPCQKFIEKIRSTKHVRHPAHPSVGRTSLSTTPTPPFSLMSVLVDLDHGYLLPCADRSTTFTSKLWTSLANLLCITLHQTTAYNPAANCMVQRFYCTLKAALMSCLKDSNWFTQLSWVLMGLRTTLIDVLDDWMVVHGETLTSVTSSNNLQHLRHIVGKFTPCPQTYKPPAKQQILTDLHSKTHVFLHNDSSKPFPCVPSYA
ncbi:uncharacterized protein [Palaemon carinicauda]|uniref:uncharacterized protein n=1 Tax=Palaemon carinicauda TaxID=392227 RepID=UPI0035B67079